MWLGWIESDQFQSTIQCRLKKAASEGVFKHWPDLSVYINLRPDNFLASMEVGVV